MSIFLSSVFDVIEQKAKNYIQDGHLRSMDDVDILNVYSMFLEDQLEDDNNVSLDDSIVSRGRYVKYFRYNNKETVFCIELREHLMETLNDWLTFNV